MKSRTSLFIAFVCVMMVLVAMPAVAHNWGCWIQPNRTVYVRNTASNYSQANAALNEWSNDTILNIVNVSYHTEVSVYDGNYGNTGWGGLASIQSYSGCTIYHGHALLNTYYSYTSNGKRGVFCQEVGHLFGLDHSNDGGCMGGGYFYSINSNYNVVSHNINDIANKYAGVPAVDFEFTDKHEGHGADVGGEGRPLVHAVWYYNPQSLRELSGLASAVVVATVAGVYDAADIVVPVEGLEDGESRIPNQRVLFRTDRLLNGKVEREFDLFHTGNDEFVLDGDPAYEIGETYVLFLRPREDGSYLVVSPQGRYEVTAEGLEPMTEIGFAALMRGSDVDSLARDLGELVGRK